MQKEKHFTEDMGYKIAIPAPQLGGVLKERQYAR
jgi:hypothetical protein